MGAPRVSLLLPVCNAAATLPAASALPTSAMGATRERCVDIDPRKIGKRMRGRPVLAPVDLPPPGRDFVLAYVGSHGARDLIAARLDATGRRIGIDYLPAA